MIKMGTRMKGGEKESYDRVAKRLTSGCLRSFNEPTVRERNMEDERPRHERKRRKLEGKEGGDCVCTVSS